MSEELRLDIRRCMKYLDEYEYNPGRRAAAYASGYLHNYPELAALLDMISGTER